ncbi:unnamed protein product, partial [marine sediment metagenome]
LFYAKRRIFKINVVYKKKKEEMGVIDDYKKI